MTLTFEVKSSVEQIKANNLVHNFSSLDIPDEAYLYLVLGSTFAPVKDVTRHDHSFDTKLFGRKVAWAVFHHKQLQSQESNGQEEEPAPEDEENHRWSYSNTLAPTGSS
jgi:hypothetical protein